MTGSFGRMGTFSFNGNKTITCGGGGAIVTNDLNLGLRAKHLTTTAKQSHPFEFYHDELGYNFRMPNLNAALACAQLELLPQILENKRELAHRYQSYFKEQGICFRTEMPNTKANYWLMCLELENKAQRDIFLKETNLAGVMTRPIWQLMHRLPMYKDCQRDEQVNAHYLEERIVNIPSSYRP
jgi:dTDP-4-amino-4,6-dideoxygalactose transaminase